MARNGNMTRFGVSVDQRLLERFDVLLDKKGYVNRSEAIRDIMRDQIVESSLSEDNREMIGTINIVYNHGLKALAEKISELEHHNHSHIISTLHVHLDRNRCFEALIVRGKMSDIKYISEKLIGIKGVIHGKLTLCTSDHDFM